MKADATDPNSKFSASQRIQLSGNGGKLALLAGAQIGLRTVHFGGGPQTLVLWATWVANNMSFASMYIYNDSDKIPMFTKHDLPSFSGTSILDGCLGARNPGTTGESVIYYGLTPRTATSPNTVLWSVWDQVSQMWEEYATYTPRSTSNGYNSLCILDWSAKCQMIKGYYRSDGASADIDLYEHSSDSDLFMFTYRGLWTNDTAGAGDRTRGGMQSAQLVDPSTNLSCAVFEGIDGGPVGKISVCVHTNQWYYGTLVLNCFTTTTPGIAAYQNVVYCVWTQRDGSGQIQYAVGKQLPGKFQMVNA